MAASFSNSGEDVIRRGVTASQMELADGASIRQTFDVAETVQWINSNAFEKVALQFPDELMSFSVDIVQLLTKETSSAIVILADTSYGSCCVDEIAAEHYAVDAIVHYGPACLSPIRRLPVFYVFGQQSLDVNDCVCQLKPLLDVNRPTVVLYDVIYHHCMNLVKSELSKDFPNILVPVLDLPEQQSNSSSLCQESNISSTSRQSFTRFGRRFQLFEETEINDYLMVFIGREGLLQNACMMTFNRCNFITYDPESKTCKSDAWNANKQLMRRYYMIEKAKDAERVGILIGTLGVKDYLAILDRLSSAIHSAGKKCYKFVVGKLNVAKLANFSDIDVFVLVACPENSLIDSSEMFQPVVTPFEMELACNSSREWTGDYEVDFRQLLPGGLSYREMTPDPKARMDVSLVTGKVRQLGVDEDEKSSAVKCAESLAVVESRNEIVVHGSAADFLSNRSWHGLDPQLGRTPVVKAVQGMKGTATSYNSEPAS